MSGTSNGPKNAAVEEWHFLLDTRDAESRYGIEPVDHLTPEALFKRQWALAIMEQALLCLRLEYKAAQKEQLFDGIKKSLTEELDAPSHAQLAERLKMTTGAVKTAAHRLRRRYREILRDEIAQTVANPESLEEEIRDLINCL